MTTKATLFIVFIFAACGDDLHTEPDAADHPQVLDLFGEACEQSPAADVTVCHSGAGACIVQHGIAVCRPWCAVGEQYVCAQMQAVVYRDARGACVCTPN